jgi:hypothetical protein
MLILVIVGLVFVFAAGYFIGTQNEGIPEGIFDGRLVVKSIDGDGEDEEDRVVLSMQFDEEIDIDQIENKKQVTFQVVTE